MMWGKLLHKPFGQPYFAPKYRATKGILRFLEGGIR